MKFLYTVAFYVLESIYYKSLSQVPAAIIFFAERIIGYFLFCGLDLLVPYPDHTKIG